MIQLPHSGIDTSTVNRPRKVYMHKHLTESVLIDNLLLIYVRKSRMQLHDPEVSLNLSDCCV
jgi:hypothetical protein